MQGGIPSGQAGAGRLIAQLADYATRSRAMTQLVMMGAAAVPALVDALASPIEGVAWSAAKTLGQIGAADAVEPLTKALSNPALKEVAAEAIRRITGKEPVTEPAGAAEQAARGDSAAHLADEQLAKAIASSSMTIERGAAGCLFSVRLPNGRHQRVDVLLNLKDQEGAPIVALYTECGPASPERYEWALKSNLKTPFGAFAIRDTSHGQKFVMVDAYLRDTAGILQLRKAVETLARKADALERELTGEDRQ